MTDTTRTDPAIREVPLAPGAEVEILLTSNALRLRGTDGDRLVVRARDGRSLDREIRIDTDPEHVRVREDETGDLRIGPLRVRSRPSVDIDVDVPRTARVSVRTMSGDVDAVGVGGASRWATASGDLRLQLEAGPASIESMSGDVTLVSPGALSLAVRSVSGRLRLRASRFDGLAASTTSGDVGVEGDLASDTEHVISSVSGAVRLATASDVHLEAQTVTGDIRASVAHRAEGGRGRRTLVVGAGTVRVSVRTMSGDVSLEGNRALGNEPPQVPEPWAFAATPEPPASEPQVPSEAPVAPPRSESPIAAPVVEPPVVVAEASAAPNLVRIPAMPAPAAGPATAGPELGDAGSTDRREAARLEVLRALERGDLDVETASRRLQALEEAGPRGFRGFC